MHFRAFRKREDGAVAVIVALCMTALLGFTALAVDFGMLAVCRQTLQNAADAAALAGAADFGANHAYKVYPTVKSYCSANGCDPEDKDVSLEMKMTQSTVTVTLRREIVMGFSGVLTGKNHRTVTATATAQAQSIFGNCPYAMFAGQHIDDDGTGIEISGNDITINGDIHSNSDISMKKAVLGPGATATAVNRTDPDTDGWSSNAIARDMPSFRSFSSALDGMEELVEFPNSVVKSSKNGFQELIFDATVKYHAKMGVYCLNYLKQGLFIHIAGDLTFNGNSSTAYQTQFPVILVVDGDVDLNGACLNSSSEAPVCIMSKEGNVTVNGGGAEFFGIVFAPQGNVTLNGNDASFVGSIVGKNIRKAGGKITVCYEEDLDRFLPKTKVRLIA